MWWKKVLLQKVFCSSISFLAKGHVFKRKHALCVRMVSFIAPTICFSLLTPIPCLSLHLCTLVTRDCTPCCFRLSRPQRPSIQPIHIAKHDNELNAPDLSIIHGSLWLPVHKVGFCAPWSPSCQVFARVHLSNLMDTFFRIPLHVSSFFPLRVQN